MTINRITPEELYSKMNAQEELVLVDVRAAEKYNDFHISGSSIKGMNIPKTEIFKIEDGTEHNISEMPRNKELIITCTTGNSAAKCASILSEKEYDVVLLEGGITAWQEYLSNESVVRMWEKFKAGNPEAPGSYEAWAFGDSKEMADELAELVLTGKKTGTASNYLLYELENEPLAHVGLHNIILNGEGQAVAVVVTTSVEVIPFDEVTEEHAHSEGEGDCSLRYWREVHQDFFERELKSVNGEFHDNIPVVCERFKLVYQN
ncbi:MULTISPECIES: ASCH domain-containing protein [Sporosarcina]|uniref:ASCH domain-containing protein n=1 Tax=Sporosarcina TaxID=1569 RepID=UPI00129A8444|nr:MULTISPECIES: ASCH domain-containing protein [Sporosarcina]GKV65314.1 hypothetical protein NCCP2331_14670 [Sporosarcina sp. NCCP-2331]GLB55438.1 hypothetical protein NCCP2378_12250 [Sporosarcina sp. NCCP-2378]